VIKRRPEIFVTIARERPKIAEELRRNRIERE
jgi:hypothetical protein